MKRHLNTLFVTTQGTYLFKDGETLALKVEDTVKLRLPIHTLEGVVCFGQVSASPFLLGHCAAHGVSVSFLTEHGRFLASVQGPTSGNVLLRRRQYRLADDPAASAALARFFLSGKLANARAVLRRALRDHGGKIEAEAVGQAIDRLSQHLDRLRTDMALDAARGMEGDAAHAYYGVFDHLIVAGKGDFAFAGRNRRPPLDPVNCLLSFLYVLLAHDVRSALETTGLDPAVGFLHRDRPGRPGLALDLMEEFRPFFADRLALTLMNLGKVKGKGFKRLESGAVVMDDATRKEVLMAYQERKQDVVEHPFLREKMPIGLLFHTQALLFARHLRGDLDGYPPYLWK
ncbi:MAG: type I-C CRISPR-associated endonuclease Cas1c [Solidesulfovibrio sp.]|uniref:type I-C CRISPR-associated endonuclease Cas1c n=1 Tax=Solidesulfovibrio sp. TaxID=2910990 RepID=UPI002B1FFFFA|nr:type I-C CRISPR-associated endonuclease Cas1c [Solidesulfovibrio sp.]MEA4855980.1 type I-C CRISPR-associated endonuclease Cas1c [Solidesulfovibrio sp.]